VDENCVRLPAFLAVRALNFGLPATWHLLYRITAQNRGP
jgi:hypothetical protein